MSTKGHIWPKDGEHMYGKWQNKSRTEQYRQCVHPNCHDFETRPVPKA